MKFPSSPYFQQLHQDYRISEAELMQRLSAMWDADSYPSEVIQKKAIAWVEAMRNTNSWHLSVNHMLSVFPLSSEEGRALMMLAEALLRIPDRGTRDKLIREKITDAEWYKQSKSSSHMLLRFMGIGLDLSKFALNMGEGTVFESLLKFSKKLTTPAIRQSVLLAMGKMGDLFVLGETIESAMANTRPDYTYSFDMLGEAAVSMEDADRYFNDYVSTIHAAGKVGHKGVSVKLSALYPRYEVLKRKEAVDALSDSLLKLALISQQYDMRLLVDAEESERLLPSLEIFERVFLNEGLRDYHGLGMAVQAYQKRASATIDYLADLCTRAGKSMPVRLVKGAYWDREIKVAQELGLIDFPVFTQKVHTDANYLHCAQKLFAHACFLPQLASHNVNTLASIVHMAGERPFILQRLQGMGDEVFDLIQKDFPYVSCEIYAPVGPHKDLLPYLVRRLLENGASSSFVHKILDKEIKAETLCEDPFEVIQSTLGVPHPKILFPKHMFKDRANAKGVDISDYPTLENLQKDMVVTPNLSRSFPEFHVNHVFEKASVAQRKWDHVGVEVRAKILEKLADLMEDDHDLLNLIIYEGKRTLLDAHSEVREAVDFCRYYALHARKFMAQPQILPGPVGEHNALSLHPRGIFVCISPWNFPLAIFMGQVAAVLVTGNAVIAKPASVTTHIAAYAVNLAHKAGVPEDVLTLCTLPAKDMQSVIEHPLASGIIMTGSTETAQTIQRTLAMKKGPLTPLIAETGGLNAMVVDASCLFEQVVQDVMTSAFRSAGQRCSALRILCVQEDIAEGFLTLLTQAMNTLTVGPSHKLETDVGPVISENAKQGIEAQIKTLSKRAERLHKISTPKQGDYIAPQVWKIKDITEVNEEIFGPVLQVVTYEAQDMENLLHKINALGYGLTFGLHTRLQTHIDLVQKVIHAGNIYVNRSMIGAVVGVQPFGGEGMSGTGFKAGGPYYLLKFMTERTLSHNTTAAGGNASLMMEIQ